MSGPILLGLRILSAIALYAFLGWALFLIWNSLRAVTEQQKARKLIPIRVEHNAQASIFARSEVLIGRDSGCHCCLADSTVSAYHARLTYHHSQWWAEDLNSKNGTLLNDEPLKTPTVLVDGDTLRCGNTDLTIRLSLSADGQQETGL